MLEKVKSIVKRAVIEWLLWKERRADGTDSQEIDRLRPELWQCGVDAHGVMTVDGVTFSDLAVQYGTPLHVLNEKALLGTYQEFLDSFRAVYPNLILATSYKTNPVPYVLQLLHKSGSYAEAISHFELWLALELGVAPERIILNGPGKGDDALRLAVEQRVRIINVDGPSEIKKIARFARQFGVRQAVGLRVITSVGWSSQFGLSIVSGAAEAAFRQILEHPELSPIGLHLHLGSGIQSIETYTQAVSELVEFSELLRSRLGIEIDIFDLGGGFGVPTVRGKTDWDNRMISLGYSSRPAKPAGVPRPEDYAQALSSLLKRLMPPDEPNTAGPTVIMEPGRAITSSGQILLLSVVGKKNSPDGTTYLIADGGKNITMPLEWETHQIFPASRMAAADSFKHDIFGPLCHPGDIIAKSQLLPEMSEGDLLAIMDAGAYFIPNQMNFSNPRPPVVRVRNGEHFVVRERETFHDIVRLDRLQGSE